MTHQPRPATIIETPTGANGYRYIVDADDGERFFLAGMGAPKSESAGARGTLTYTVGASFGLYFWATV